VENVAGGITTSYGLKHSEMKVRQLSTVVGMSKLGCREELSVRLEKFADDLRASSKLMSRFSQKSMGVLHELKDLDRGILRQLEHLQAERIAAEAYSDAYRLLVSPFRPLPSHDLAASEQKISDTFMQSSYEVTESIRGLLAETQVTVVGLNDMEEALFTIFNVIHRESSTEDFDQSNGGWELFLKFLFENDLVTQEKQQLLQEVSGYRAEASVLVQKTLVMLLHLEEGLKALRERVAEPVVLMAAGSTPDQIAIPLDEQIQSIRGGMEKMNALLLRTYTRNQKEMTLLMSGDV